jgi:hypothetical protein
MTTIIPLLGLAALANAVREEVTNVQSSLDPNGPASETESEVQFLQITAPTGTTSTLTTVESVASAKTAAMHATCPMTPAGEVIRSRRQRAQRQEGDLNKLIETTVTGVHQHCQKQKQDGAQ